MVCALCSLYEFGVNFHSARQFSLQIPCEKKETETETNTVSKTKLNENQSNGQSLRATSVQLNSLFRVVCIHFW